MILKKKYYNDKLLHDAKLQKDFSQIIKGYVSFLRTGAFVNYKYIGNLKIGPSQLTILEVHPKPLQYAGYAKAYNIDVKKQKKSTCFKIKSTKQKLAWGKELNTVKTSEKSGIYSNSIQASLFVWDNSIQLYRGKGKLHHKKAFWLKNISEYSTIYGKIIQKILTNSKKKHFIYLKKVEGSGSKLLFHILQKCGINSKYIQSQKDTEEFNTPGNTFRVAIGTAKISLGLTLRNIDYIHIAEPDWNFPPIDQAIARAIRHGSHDRKNTVIEIFLYALIIKGKRDCSVNYLQYTKCSEKLHATKIMTEILRKNAIDCQLFKTQNKTKKCTGISSPRQPPNYLTYNLYYSPFEQIRDDVCNLFNSQFILSLDQINKRLPQYNEFELMNALSRINSENIIMYNKWGFKNYLRYNNNIYFLVIDKFSKGDWLDVYYSRFVKNNPVRIPDDQFINILFANQCTFIMRTFEHDKHIREFFQEFPIAIQEKILQVMLTQKKTKFPKFETWLKTKYNKVWKKKKSGIILVYLQHLKDRKFPIKEWKRNKWIDSKKKIDFGKEIYETFVKKNKFIGVQDDKLIILDVRTVKKLKKSQGSKKLRGIACTSMKDERWPALLKFLKIADSGTQKQLCKQVVEKLYEKNLIIDKNEQHMLNIYMKDNKLAFFKK